MTAKIQARRMTSNLARQQANEFRSQAKRRTKSPPELENKSSPPTKKASADISDVIEYKNEIDRLTAIIDEEKLKEAKRQNTARATKCRQKKQAEGLNQFKDKAKTLEGQLDLLTKNYDKLSKDSQVLYDFQIRLAAYSCK
jgi:hypothetical protein